ncbi:hypothetical protein IGI96_003630 [Enterococcus sp. DIV0421]|uniref:MurR/RpiR family transcriptional regulator n=1 Tax=Enterococcus sp. DIV0421 TaxID=2774688 RepID=UPI003F275577
MVAVFNIISHIESNISNMSDMEESVARFFISEVHKESDLSAEHVCEIVHCSLSALTRFSKKCGFKGYREFIFEYRNSQKQLNERVKHFKNDITPNIFKDYEDIIEKTQSLIDEEQLERVSSMLVNASRIYLYGAGFSGLVAKEVKIRFVRLGLVTEVIHDLDNLVWTSGIIDSSCLVIGFSLSGESRIVVNALQNASRIGARSILLTSNLEGSSHVEEVIKVASIRNLDQGTRISPQLPILFMIDIIYGYFLSADKSHRLEIFNRTVVNHDDNDKVLKMFQTKD